MAPGLSIDVVFDPICPWCLIGKRHLARAQALLAHTDPDVAVRVHWLATQLLAHLPAQGLPFMEFYIRRLGSPQAVLARQAQVNAAAAAAGFQIDFSRITRMPNTGLALRLLDYTSTIGSDEQQADVIEHLFGAHFLQGRDISDVPTLVALAQACGLDGDPVRACLSNTGDIAPASAQRPAAREGVPYFLFNGQYALAGAQPPEVLLQAMRRALGQDERHTERAA